MSSAANAYPPALTQSQLDTLFPLQRSKEPIKPNSYEFAFCLAGTVSAGAYTAGVLDYILEALDAWTLAKDNGSADAPKHEAILSTITGASGGAINGAILARVASFAFPHGPVTGNPFYDIWVNSISLNDLLAPDNDPKFLASLFNTGVFDSAARDLVQKTAAPLGSDGVTPKERTFFADPIRLTIMVANVTGIPYTIQFRGQSGLGHDLVAHTDWARFSLTVPGGANNSPMARPDELALSSSSTFNWDIVQQAALSTSAFPAAFPSRALQRPFEGLGYRVAVVPGDDKTGAQIAQLRPEWPLLEPGVTNDVMQTVNVDGGTLNNEPLDMARTALAGYFGRNDRDGLNAIRGVVMVDPFSDAETIDLFKPPSFLNILGPLVSTLVMQARFKPEDIALAYDYDTYSRFLVAPFGAAGGAKQVPGSGAIAAGGLGGFLGFLDKRFLHYDFMLGRRNAYDFLTKEFVLPENSKVFTGMWTLEQKAFQGVPETNPGPGRPDRYLPIIPVMPGLRAKMPKDPQYQSWPRIKDVPADLADRVGKRIDSVYAALKAELKTAKTWPGFVAGGAIDAAYSLFLRGTIRDKIVGAFRGALKDQNLLPDFTQTFPKTTDGLTSAYASRDEWLEAGASTSVVTGDANHWIVTAHWNVA